MTAETLAQKRNHGIFYCLDNTNRILTLQEKQLTSLDSQKFFRLCHTERDVCSQLKYDYT